MLCNEIIFIGNNDVLGGRKTKVLHLFNERSLVDETSDAVRDSIYLFQ